MPWKMREKPQTIRLTAALAKQWAEMTPVPHDRPLSDRRIAFYHAELDAGNFRTCSWASVYCRQTKQTYRANGKHTSMLFSQLVKIPEFYVTIEKYECATLTDVAELYATFDPRISTRGIGDINHAVAAAIPALATIPSFTLNALVSGLGYYVWKDDTRRKLAMDRARLLHLYTDFSVWFTSFAPTTVPRPYHRQAVIGAALATWEIDRKDKMDTDTFWRQTRDETGPTPDSPDRQLGRWLAVTVTRHYHPRPPLNGRVEANSREIYSRCILAWNAWRRGETVVTSRYTPTSPIPEPV